MFHITKKTCINLCRFLSYLYFCVKFLSHEPRNLPYHVIARRMPPKQSIILRLRLLRRPAKRDCLAMTFRGFLVHGLGHWQKDFIFHIAKILPNSSMLTRQYYMDRHRKYMRGIARAHSSRLIFADATMLLCSHEKRVLERLPKCCFH